MISNVSKTRNSISSYLQSYSVLSYQTACVHVINESIWFGHELSDWEQPDLLLLGFVLRRRKGGLHEGMTSLQHTRKILSWRRYLRERMHLCDLVFQNWVNWHKINCMSSLCTTYCESCEGVAHTKFMPCKGCLQLFELLNHTSLEGESRAQ